MGQGNALLYPRPSVRAASVPGAGSMLLMFLVPPNNRCMRPTCASQRG